ncbi:MAG: N-acetylmuramoyl-L-alanine amidase [Cyanobacteriota bacterium]|nr:N-acetylmuramoyl-L-alanine amidase [Cyanobacteriota bacterium]
MPRCRPGRSARLTGLLLAAALPLSLLSALPAWAASALSAWRLGRDGVLELRTAPAAPLRAFYEEGRGGVGPRIWIDLPGAPQRTRSLPGSGSLRQIRIGRPGPDTTRLVLEFQPGTNLDPSRLRLVGTSAVRWRMELGSTAAAAAVIGEGDLDAPAATAWRPQGSWQPRLPQASGAAVSRLPDVPRGRYTVVIDPGHGGPDPGAVGINGLRETDVVLDVGLQVAQLLQAKGVRVLLTRTSEVDVDLPPRVALANNSGADVFLSLHANALSMARPDVNGVETFYFESSRSRALAQSVQEQIMAISPGTPDRGARPGRFFVIRRTVMPAALAEMGFVTGSLDAPRLADPAFRRRMAVAVANGVLRYLVSNP